MTAPVRDFLRVAREYVSWADHGMLSGSETAFCLQILARLYLAALSLPKSHGDEVESLPEVPMADEERVSKRFSSMPFQYYSEIFDPIEIPPGEPVMGDLCDDLVDIYADLRCGIEACEAGHVQAAVFWWRTSFGVHWGQHLTSALRALHCYETRA
jgi:hypothetical protein